MQLLYPGRFALPLTISVATLLAALGRFSAAPMTSHQFLLPLGLIAAGLEELYFWSAKKETTPAASRRDR